MASWNKLSSLQKTLVLVGAGLSACIVVVACSMVSSPESPNENIAVKPPADSAEPVPRESTLTGGTQTGKEIVSNRRNPPLRAPRRNVPFTTDEIAAARTRIAQTDDYRSRIELRRALLYPLCRNGQLDEGMREFDALLDNVEQAESRSMAERVALADAGNLKGQEQHKAAIAAYERLLQRWPDSRFAAEALYHTGECHLEERNYADAERIFQRLIEEHDGAPEAGWGWRKLALAQLLQGQFDTSLATLEVMSGKYAGTSFGEYARMRRGYVQMAAGRVSEAKATYKSFLATCAGSKYCRLVEKQMQELNRFVLARAGS